MKIFSRTSSEHFYAPELVVMIVFYHFIAKSLANTKNHGQTNGITYSTFQRWI